MAVDYTSPEWDRSALLVIDMQNDFVLADGAQPVPGTTDVVDRLAGLIESFRRAGRPVVHLVRLYEPGSADVDPPRRGAVEAGAEFVAPGTRGAEIPPALLPDPGELTAGVLLAGGQQRIGPDEIILFKPRWSAFYRTTLDSWLRARDVSTVVVAGCNLPNCPRATLFDASSRDYRTVLVPDATSQVTRSRLDDLALIGVHAVSAGDVAAELTRTPATPS